MIVNYPLSNLVRHLVVEEVEQQVEVEFQVEVDIQVVQLVEVVVAVEVEVVEVFVSPTLPSIVLQ
jgi:hypothetical protein